VKKILSRFDSKAAMTMVELAIYAGIMTSLGLVTYSLLRSTTILGAKNSNINLTHNELRGTFDRVADHLLGANNVATLINTSGTALATQVGSNAPGVKFDRVVGDPYLLHPWQTAGALTSGATGCSVWRSVAATATAPKPEVGDIMLIPTATGNIRGVIASVALLPESGGKQKIDLTFTGAVGKSLNWGTGQPQAAKLVRPEAFLVMPNGSKNELRYYKNFDPLPTNLNDIDKYRVLSDQIGTAAGEGTPFTIQDYNGDKIIRSTLQVRERADLNWIANDEANGFNTYFQLLVNLPSRLRPKTTN
jgi:hypothetical protein